MQTRKEALMKIRMIADAAIVAAMLMISVPSLAEEQPLPAPDSAPAVVESAADDAREESLLP